MRRLPQLTVLLMGLAACNQNTELGNDREGQIDAAPAPAPIMSAAAALENVAKAAIKPETMSDADIAALGGKRGRCAVKLTEVGFPSFLYGREARGAIKLNGKLIILPKTSENRFEGDGLIVRLQPVDGVGNAGLQSIDFVIVPPGAKDEIGYRGYVRCYDNGDV